MGTLIALIPFLQTVQLLIKPKWDFVMAQKLTSRLFCCPPAVCATSCKVKVRHSHNITTGRYWAAAAARPPGRDLFRKPFGYNYFYFTRVLSNIFIPPPRVERGSWGLASLTEVSSTTITTYSSSPLLLALLSRLFVGSDRNSTAI